MIQTLLKLFVKNKINKTNSFCLFSLQARLGKYCVFNKYLSIYRSWLHLPFSVTAYVFLMLGWGQCKGTLRAVTDYSSTCREAGSWRRQCTKYVVQPVCTLLLLMLLLVHPPSGDKLKVLPHKELKSTWVLKTIKIVHFLSLSCCIFSHCIIFTEAKVLHQLLFV